jgi:hypothetical protein
MMSQVCAILSDLDLFSDDSSSSEEDERPKRKTYDFTGLCVMGKSSRHIFDSDSDVSDDSFPESLSLRVVKLENALCNQDKLLCKIFRENKKLNLEHESASSDIASLRSAHDDMIAKPCDKCNMIMVNYADLWLVNSHIASLLDGARWELRELKARSTLLGGCTSCLDLIWRLLSLRLKILSTNLIIFLTTLFYPLRVKRVSLSRVSVCFNPKRETRKETPKTREEAFIYMFCGHVGHLDEFYFWWKRIKRRHVEYARNSYRDEFIDFPPRSYSRILPHSYSRASPHTFSRDLPRTSSCALPQFSYGPNYRSYDFGSRENRLEPRRFGYNPCPHRGDRFLCRPGFPAGGSFTHFEPRHLNDSRFPHRGSRPTRPSSEVQRTVRTSSGRMVKCWIRKIYLTNTSTKPSTFSHSI